LALFIAGMRCAICGKRVESDEEMIGFPHIFGNEADPLYPFSDAVVYAKCLRADPRAAAAEAALSAWRSKKGKPKICSFCREQIIHPDDHFGLGRLTDDPLSPMRAWNGFEFHEDCVRHWEELPKLIQLAKVELREGRWKGKSLEFFVRVLESHLISPDREERRKMNVAWFNSYQSKQQVGEPRDSG
jgi:hypothetical protein